ncbi:hypothetical protein DRX19_11460 [Salmonella enterica subsp. enterica]|uniref:Uncharacterized protein n=1 Tax=Salmonella enterica TaxID=28901 RepID=A0A5T8B921_SALER|nr:hypothetical protein [Salmonella enterica subsp. enterica serovar Pensacola]EBM2192935.1 hypothetical protein [Salmonella enterica]EBN4400198.1 hypothetical protein [Salmonella enterica]ECW2472566.1 hypothetical protein [Salmonella enterica subsp. enterica serovar Florida]
MKKIIAVTLLILVVFTFFFIIQSNKPDKNLPTDSPLIIKSSLPGECRVTSIPTTNSANINNTIVACKIQLRKEY